MSVTFSPGSTHHPNVVRASDGGTVGRLSCLHHSVTGVSVKSATESTNATDSKFRSSVIVWIQPKLPVAGTNRRVHDRRPTRTRRHRPFAFSRGRRSEHVRDKVSSKHIICEINSYDDNRALSRLRMCPHNTPPHATGAARPSGGRSGPGPSMNPRWRPTGTPVAATIVSVVPSKPLLSTLRDRVRSHTCVRA